MICTSPTFIRVIKSRIIRWAGHVARRAERRGAYRVLVGRPEDKRPLERPIHRWRIILRWLFRKWDGEALTELIWLRIGTGGGLL
jgi:hypothetical protein